LKPEGISKTEEGIASREKLLVCVVISMSVTSTGVWAAGAGLVAAAGAGAGAGAAGLALCLPQALIRAPPRAEPGMPSLLLSPTAVFLAVSVATCPAAEPPLEGGGAEDIEGDERVDHRLVSGVVDLQHDVRPEGLDGIEQDGAGVDAEIALALVEHHVVLLQVHRAAGEMPARGAMARGATLQYGS